MAERQQAIRVHFLIALTLAVALFGLIRFRGVYERRQVRTEYQETAQQLRSYVETLLKAEHRDLAMLAARERGAIGRDAAALQLQVENLRRGLDERLSLAELRRRERALRAIQTNFRRLRDGRRAIFPHGEPFLRAYFSPVDGRLRPYGICVPADYDPARPCPVIVRLERGADGPSCYGGAICVAPGWRPDAGHVGEDDVLAILEDVEHLYSIEQGRIYLLGEPAGAAGCWHLAVHHPDLFGGLVALGAGTGGGPWLQRPRWHEMPGGAHRDLLAFLPASLWPVSFAENLGFCHVAAVQSGMAQGGATELTRAMVQRLRELGYPFEYLQFPGTAAEPPPSWAWQYAQAKVFGEPVAASPERFSFKTAHLRHNRAWWLTIDRFIDPVSFALVKAQTTDAAAELSTANVAALSVHAERLPSRVRTVAVDGQQFAARGPAAAEGVLRLAREGEGWRLASPDGPALKRRGRSGPFSELLQEPFLVAYGTAGQSELHKAISRHEAERFAADWEARMGQVPPLKADSDVTRQDMVERNLVLFGAPAVNRVAAQVAFARPAPDQEHPVALPLRITADSVTLGEEVFTGQDVGVVLCYPNPFAPDRMVGLVAGTTPAALYQAYRRTELPLAWDGLGHYHWFDYAVFDRRTAGLQGLLIAGFFDNAWRRVPEGPAPGAAEWRADGRARAFAAPQGFPTLESAADGRRPQVMLSDVRPVRVEQEHGALGFDRSFDGGPIRLGGQPFKRGLGMNAPSRAVFRLGGVFRELQATAGLTGRFGEDVPARARDEQIVLEVYGDGRLLAASGPLSRADEARAWVRITADLRGVQVLELAARPAGGRTGFDGACAWGDPVLAR